MSTAETTGELPPSVDPPKPGDGIAQPDQSLPEERAGITPAISSSDLTLARVTQDGHYYTYQRRGYFRIARFLEAFALDGTSYRNGGFLIVPEDGTAPYVITDENQFRRDYRLTPPAKRLEPE